MDQYGSFENTEADAQDLRYALGEGKPIVFTWSHNKVDAYIFLVDPVFLKLGTMAFGGNPDGRVYVGLYGKGCNHFSKDEIHPGYWEEKLNLDKGGAEAWAEFWPKIWL